MAYAYRKVITDSRLNKSKTIVAPTFEEFEEKVRIQRRQWEEQWIKETKKQEKSKTEAQGIAEAERASRQADDIQKKIENILLDSLDRRLVEFEMLKDNSPYSGERPRKPVYIRELREPARTDEKYNPNPGLLTKLFSMDKYYAENDALYDKDHDIWQEENNLILRTNKERENEYNELLLQWERDKYKYEKDQEDYNASIDRFQADFFNSETTAIEEYIGMQLNNIFIPIEYSSSFDVEYDQENRSVIVDAVFPTVEDIPNLKSVSYVKARQEIKESFYSDTQLRKKYDEAIYQMVLVFLNRVFQTNTVKDLIDSVVLNGIVNTIDKTTGNEIAPCILTIRINRENFESLNLTALEPKAWFRSSRGTSAANIATVTPVQPVQTMNKGDRRFVEGYSVIDGVDSGVNIAAFDWMDFENLVREVFDQEFSGIGGEVKITQASRDGGVDAVAFDPDPIRGGKIIIQAKRYTNVVGVSAVRDLYGTLLNEGAMKGILVTTSYYGNDAYKFAQGKPIQLIDGAGLLGLLEKHGHNARINLSEAKRILKEKDSNA